VAIVSVMVAIVPVAFGMPAMFVLIPPSVAAIPAAFPFFAKFLASMCGLAAAVSVAGDCLVQTMVSTGDAALAVTCRRMHRRRCGKHQNGRQRQRDPQMIDRRISLLKAHWKTSS
jgi:membrane protein implicated in regulation of membrane protease activity